MMLVKCSVHTVYASHDRSDTYYMNLTISYRFRRTERKQNQTAAYCVNVVK